MSQNLILPDGKNLGASKDNATYVHRQTFASASWVIAHNLGKFPSVVCVESTGIVIYGNIVYNSNTQVTVGFNTTCSGNAYLN